MEGISGSGNVKKELHQSTLQSSMQQNVLSIAVSLKSTQILL
jgi:hypothetical protein